MYVFSHSRYMFSNVIGSISLFWPGDPWFLTPKYQFESLGSVGEFLNLFTRKDTVHHPVIIVLLVALRVSIGRQVKATLLR